MMPLSLRELVVQSQANVRRLLDLLERIAVALEGIDYELEEARRRERDAERY